MSDNTDDRMPASIRQALDSLQVLLENQIVAASKAAEAIKHDLDAVRDTRMAIQRKTEELERIYNTAQQNAARMAAEYERLTSINARVAAALVLTPPLSPQAPKRAVQAMRDTPQLVQRLGAAAASLDGLDVLCGVYFLLQDADVVYVGQSVNILYRLSDHCMQKRGQFNRWCYIKVPKEQLDEVEGHYITLLRPRLNIKGKPLLLADNDPAIRQEAA